jgi:hypothetical protein
VDRFRDIAEGVDILLTHGPPYGILDLLELQPGTHWGSSKELRKAIVKSCPRVHCFGHVHEQRGFWQHDAPGMAFGGGCEYEIAVGVSPTHDPPPPDYPCQVISCNAMSGHAGIDSSPCGICPGSGAGRIAGPARLILAERPAGARDWNFKVAPTSSDDFRCGICK